jgi:hypothetical protein
MNLFVVFGVTKNLVFGCPKKMWKKTRKSFKCLICGFLFLASCQKKEEKSLPRCIYDQTVFAEACLKAIHDEAQFAHFKRDPFFNLLWENSTCEEGQNYLQKIKQHYPFLLEKLEKFREVDSIGSPRTYSFEGVGLISPSTLRLASIAGDLQLKLGDLSHLRVVQIGAGYGGLCKILHDLFDLKTYVIVDLKEPLELAKKCLKSLALENVIFLTPEELSKDANYDLVISDLNFSEFNRSYQQLFFDRIFTRCRSGYLLGRVFPKHFGVIAWSADELKNRLEKFAKFSEWQMQEATIEKPDYFMYWKR